MLSNGFEELYKPYTKDGGSLEGAVKWLRKISGAPDVIIQEVLNQVFLELSKGHKFSVTECDCGCGLKNAHTAIEHYMLKKVRELAEEADKAYIQAAQKSTEESVKRHEEKAMEVQQRKTQDIGLLEQEKATLLERIAQLEAETKKPGIWERVRGFFRHSK